MKGEPIQLRNAHREIIASQLTNLDESITLACMAHIYQIEVKPGAVADDSGNGVTILNPITQRGCAEVAAALWNSRGDALRTSYEYWYRLYNEKVSAEVIDDLSPMWRVAADQLANIIRADSRVVAVREE